jgi:hypothetical protein
VEELVYVDEVNVNTVLKKQSPSKKNPFLRIKDRLRNLQPAGD